MCCALCRPLVIKHAGRCGQLQQQPTIFMRWKEQFFVNSQEQCGLTIAGMGSAAPPQHTRSDSGSDSGWLHRAAAQHRRQNGTFVFM